MTRIDFPNVTWVWISRKLIRVKDLAFAPECVKSIRYEYTENSHYLIVVWKGPWEPCSDLCIEYESKEDAIDDLIKITAEINEGSAALYNKYGDACSKTNT